MRPSITKDPRATQGISPGCQTGVPTKLRFALGIITERNLGLCAQLPMPSGRQLGIHRWRHAINHPPAWLTTIFIWDRCRAPSSAMGRDRADVAINAMADDTRPTVFIFSGSPVAAQVYAFRRSNFPESLFYDFEGIALVTRRQPNRFRRRRCLFPACRRLAYRHAAASPRRRPGESPVLVAHARRKLRSLAPLMVTGVLPIGRPIFTDEKCSLAPVG